MNSIEVSKNPLNDGNDGLILCSVFGCYQTGKFNFRGNVRTCSYVYLYAVHHSVAECQFGFELKHIFPSLFNYFHFVTSFTVFHSLRFNSYQPFLFQFPIKSKESDFWITWNCRKTNPWNPIKTFQSTSPCIHVYKNIHFTSNSFFSSFKKREKLLRKSGQLAKLNFEMWHGVVRLMCQLEKMFSDEVLGWWCQYCIPHRICSSPYFFSDNSVGS